MLEPSHLALRLRLVLRYYPSLVRGTVQLFQPTPADLWPIPPDAARRLAITFGLTVTDVRADVRDVATWHGPNDDDLLASLKARRKLGVESAATYLRDLRTAVGRAR